jgi:DNA invertase Pin-like site-specific DNA recombinase
MKAAIYACISTIDPNCEMQLTELREHVTRRSWDIAGEFVDNGWRGATASRPEFDSLMAGARQREFDVVLCWRMDRFGRSLQQCVSAIQELQADDSSAPVKTSTPTRRIRVPGSCCRPKRPPPNSNAN